MEEWRTIRQWACGPVWSAVLLTGVLVERSEHAGQETGAPTKPLPRANFECESVMKLVSSKDDTERMPSKGEPLSDAQRDDWGPSLPYQWHTGRRALKTVDAWRKAGG